MGWLYNLYHSEVFQGRNKKHNYFEGWYYKIIDGNETQALAIIPGVSIGREEEDHAFIQVLDGLRSKAYYHRFSLDAFHAGEKKLDVYIGENHFTGKSIHLNLDNLKGSLAFTDVSPIPTSAFSPGIMGWYSFTPFMQCYHGVVSMHHHLSGNLNFNNQDIVYEGGIGYLEKDWGTSFPKCWIWSQCNHFDIEDDVSVMASVAHIPWMGSHFIGFIVALMIGNKHYRFATYNNSKKHVEMNENSVTMTFNKRHTSLKLTCSPGPGAVLKSPIEGLMTGKVNESLQATMYLEFHQRGLPILKAQGRHAGLEIAGPVEILLD